MSTLLPIIPPSIALLRQLAWECLGGAGTASTLLGMWFAWQRQWHRSDIEERLKDRRITESVARRQMQLVEIRAALLICGGFALVVVAVFNLA